MLLDITITEGINAAAGHNALLNATAVAITTWAIPVLVLAVAAQWWIGTNRPHVRHVVVAAGLSFLAGLAVNQVILLFVHRLRPYDAGITHLLVAPSSDFSFPSDHATVAFAVATMFVLQKLPTRGTLFGIAAFVIAWSRVFVGVHYASDVLGGALIGAAGAVAVHFAYREGSTLDRIVTSIL